jgi:hypothetical protein
VTAHRRLASIGAVLLAAALCLSACASSSIQTGAATFLSEHAAVAIRTASSTRAVEADVAALGASPARAQLEHLAAAAARARREAVQAGEWSISASAEGGEEAAEEDDLPRAETEVIAAADEVGRAMLALETFARREKPAQLARYRSVLSGARERWDESIAQLWHLGKRSGPPGL